MAKKIDYASMFTLRKDGRYQGYYKDRDGKRHAVCDRDPEKLFQKIQEKESCAAAPLLFRDYADHWHDQNWDDIRDGTKQCYSAPLVRAVDRFGDRLIEDITIQDLNAHLLLLASQGFSRSTVKVQKIVYSQIFKQAILEGAINTNIATYATVPNSAMKPVKREAPEDDIIQAIKDSAQTAYFGTFALFLLCTGFRRGEALAVRWRDIDFNKGWVHCNGQIQNRGGVPVEVPTKSDAGVRAVPLLPVLRNVLIRPDGERQDDFIFHGEDPAKPMAEPTYDRRWMHYCKDMGFVRIKSQEQRISKQGHKYTHTQYAPTLTAHQLRHSYATMLYEAGIKEEAAMTYMGHSNIRITREVYTHFRKKEQEKEAARLIEHAAKVFG